MANTEINPDWQIWIMKKQVEYNETLALATFIIALVGILQVVKLYNFDVPNWIIGVIGMLVVAFTAIIIINFFNNKD